MIIPQPEAPATERRALGRWPVNRPSHLPDPWARRLRPEETAGQTEMGQRCQAPRCREPVTFYAWYFPRPRRTGVPVIGHERFLCGPHGAEFAARHHLIIEPAPAEPVEHSPGAPVRNPGPPLPPSLERLDEAAIADHLSLGGRCNWWRRCDQPDAYAVMYTTRGPRARRVLRFYCDEHAARFAARHRIDLTTVPLAEGGYR